VVVIGGGNAGLAAALTAGRLAGQSGGRVLVLDRGPAALRGGNTRHTRNIRCAHSWSDAYSPGTYLFGELWRDLCGVGTGPGNEQLAELTVRESESVPAWMTGHGVHWQPPLAGTLHLGRTNRFFLGGGKALVNTYHRALARLGVVVRYGVTVTDLVLDGDRCTGVLTEDGALLRARSVVCASGGFEANLDWLRRYWGDAADNYLIRGSADNDGRVLAALYAHGAARAGAERGFHAVAIDARSPRFDGGIATRLDSIPFGIVVNRDGRRFYDEGEDLWPKRYAIWGRNVAEQPGQIGYSIWDAKVQGLFLPPMYPPSTAGSVGALAAALGLDPDAVVGTVRSFNAAIRPGGRFDPTGLDSCSTGGLSPAKSHWAQPIDTPPFYGVPLRPGITFTYLGVAVTEQARVLRTDGSVLRNVFAAGEIMSGNILSTGYLAGFGLTIGHVWGRIAGAAAARADREAGHAG
jgi:tricarballylate dehydrogenase